MTNQFFNQVRYFSKIGIRPVDFEHGEFRIVLSEMPSFPEVAADFENLIDPPTSSRFQIKLRRDAQIKLKGRAL
jgi:hypothetical protein